LLPPLFDTETINDQVERRLVRLETRGESPAGDDTEIPRRNIFPSFSPKAGENFGGTFLSLALFLPFCIYFRKQFLKTEYSGTFSPSQLNRKTVRNISER